MTFKAKGSREVRMIRTGGKNRDSIRNGCAGYLTGEWVRAGIDMAQESAEREITTVPRDFEAIVNGPPSCKAD